ASAEFGRLLRRLIARIVVRPYRPCDGGHPVLRAHFTFSLDARAAREGAPLTRVADVRPNPASGTHGLPGAAPLEQKSGLRRPLTLLDPVPFLGSFSPFGVAHRTFPFLIVADVAVANPEQHDDRTGAGDGHAETAGAGRRLEPLREQRIRPRGDGRCVWA